MPTFKEIIEFAKEHPEVLDCEIRVFSPNTYDKYIIVHYPNSESKILELQYSIFDRQPIGSRIYSGTIRRWVTISEMSENKKELWLEYD